MTSEDVSGRNSGQVRAMADVLPAKGVEREGDREAGEEEEEGERRRENV